MYAIAVIRYRKPLEEVLKVVEEHRAYLGLLKQMDVLIASGPCEPRFGGLLLLRLPDENFDEALLAVRDQDPFVKANLAQYELLPWKPVIGKEDLDKL
jgi:uncharacterized protein YciI